MYKTIVLSLLEQLPEIHHQLRKNRILLQAVNHFASQLKASHEAWKDCHFQANPLRSESQTASESLEIAIKELEESLTYGVQADGSQPLSLGGAMAFIQGRRQPG